MKRPLDAIRAFRFAQLLVPDAELHVVGSGPEEGAVRRAGGNGVVVHGRVRDDERDALMARAHALVATSVREGWGLVVSEAAAVGTGTIAYAVPGLVDSVRATGGFLVAPAVDALARVLTEVALDPEHAAPRPTATGTQPFADVARVILAEAEVGARA
jgi:glycosyltransferase involved in cell wall biosynthesis